MPIYRPRMAIYLTLPAKGADPSETITFLAKVSAARWTKNDHTRADELSVTVAWEDAGIDPRILGSAIGRFSLGDADEFGYWDPDDDAFLRFVGRAVKSGRSAREGEAKSVTIEFLDYTSFFLVAKPLASAGVPDYSQTLKDAWARICDATPGAEELRDNIVFRGLDAPGPVIGSAVAERFAQMKGQLHVQSGADAWAVWQQCCGTLGLISFFELDQCVVTTALDYYTADDPPVLAWGRNIIGFGEERNNDFERKGIGLTSFDPLSGRTIEALWPPVGDKSIKSKRVAPKKRKSEAAIRAAEHRDYFQVEGVTNPEVLLEVAKRVYAERARQEFEGTVETAEMFIETVSEKQFDLLTLSSGDLVHIEIDEFDAAAMAGLGEPSEQERVDYYVERGYSEAAARIMAANVSDLTSLRAEFYVKTVTVELTLDGEGGEFRVEVGYCNKIAPTGDAAAE